MCSRRSEIGLDTGDRSRGVPPDDNSDVAIIVGSVLGAALGLLILVLIVVFLLRRARRTQARGKPAAEAAVVAGAAAGEEQRVQATQHLAPVAGTDEHVYATVSEVVYNSLYMRSNGTAGPAAAVMPAAVPVPPPLPPPRAQPSSMLATDIALPMPTAQALSPAPESPLSQPMQSPQLFANPLYRPAHTVLDDHRGQAMDNPLYPALRASNTAPLGVESHV
jgi:hypothetical protein